MRRRAAAAASAVAATLSAGVALSAASAFVERRVNRVQAPPRHAVSARARELTAALSIVDLHADSLLWGRDLARRSSRGHVDVPRLIEGGIAIQVLAASTKISRHVKLEGNTDRGDDVLWLALVQRWPRATWRRLLPRALHLARRADALVDRSAGAFTMIRFRDDLEAYLQRRATNANVTAGVLAIEGAHALDGEVSNIDALASAGYRMLGLSHFFDTVFAGSAHGRSKGGLTAAGRDLIARAEALGMVIDVAHASPATIDDTLDLATRPVVASHTGVRGVADNVRNLDDDHLRAIARSGGVVGIGFWPTAAGGEGTEWIVRSIVHAVSVAGVDHVGLGSDWDGAVSVPFGASGVARLTEGLLAHGLDEPSIAAVMGGNAIRVLTATLPGR
jgi:membrane dipeptidase